MCGSSLVFLIALSGVMDLRHASAIKHLGINPEGWYVTESQNFYVFDKQNGDLAERVAFVAEVTRLTMAKKWFGKGDEAWAPKCQIILHTTSKEYVRATGVPAASAGNTHIEIDPSGQRVVGRRIDLRCDNPRVIAVLLHEATHVTLAGRFGRYQVPRWADEGIAVLSEPKENVGQHRRNLVKALKEQNLFGIKNLMEMKEYPSSSRLSLFYAQSVCLTDFLAKERGPVVFTSFVRDGLREGYDIALRRHYDCDFGDLEERWQASVAK